MKNSLNSGSSWDAPAVYIYGPAIAVVALIIIYSFMRARTRYEMGTSILIVLAIAGVYASAVVTGLAMGIPFDRLKFQPHHYVSVIAE